MIVINTMEDIREVKESNKLPISLLEELERYFKDIVRNLTGGDDFESYNLQEYGSIFVAESGDNPRNVEGIELFDAPIEFVTLIEIGGIEYYKIVIVCNNESAIVVFCTAYSFGKEFESYIQDFVID
jgi:hypothetical protein